METRLPRIARPTVACLSLAPHVRLIDAERPSQGLLRCGDESAYLNPAAAAILALCNGSRTRDQVIADAVLGSDCCVSTSDVVAFLDAARDRGWVVDS
jgi:ribosomal protein L18